MKPTTLLTKPALLTMVTVLLLAAISVLPALASDRSDKDIVETAVDAGSFNTLAAALEAAGLVEALQGDGPFTVFAPTDQAFAKLPKSTLESLLRPENKDQLTQILTYHVVSGSISAEDAVSAKRARTLQGDRVSIAIEDGRLRINESNVVANDVHASNGIIHVIDAVLLPPSLDLAQVDGRKVLGIYVERPGRALASQLDVDPHESYVVTGFTSSGTAREAGLERYDVITRINGRPAGTGSLTRAKAETRVGDGVELTVFRQGRMIELDVPVSVARH